MNNPETRVRMARCRSCWNDNVEVVEDTRKNTVYYAICANERCGLHTVPFEDKEEAIKNWNHWNDPLNIKKRKDNPR